MITEIADYVINMLDENGYSAYMVGGCLRDEMLKRTSNDVDIATDALPCNIKEIFKNTYDTGIEHGTVTVMHNGECAEVTTFRVDKEYVDKRHPGKVEFVGDIYMDLARRDFTVNAMAYNKKTGLIDPYGGAKDIENKIIRAVGEPEKRFTEDALRILRCIRFAACLNFDIDNETLNAAVCLRGNLKYISRERVYNEICKTLSYADEKHLKLLVTVADDIFKNVTNDKIQRAADCRFLPSKWCILCGDECKEVLAKLKSPAIIQKTAAELLKYKEGCQEPILQAHKLKFADMEMLADFLGDKSIYKQYTKAIDKGHPIYLKDLKISGEQLFNIGYRNREIGKIKEQLLNHVIYNPDDNKEEILIKIAERRLNSENN